MTIQQVRYVIEIARHGSFSEAAKALFVSQPSLSNAVKELETELNIKIFTRTSRGIDLSAEGQEFMGYAMQLMDRAGAIAERYSGAEERARLEFSVSSQHYFFVERAFLNLLRGSEGARYDMRLRETSTIRIIEDVSTRVSEVGVLFFSDVNQRFLKKRIADNKLKYERVIRVNACALIRAEHPLAKRKAIAFEELKPYPFVLYEQEGAAAQIYGEEILPPFTPDHVVRCFDRNTLISIIRGTNGCNVGSGLIPPEKRGEIAAIPLTDEAEMEIVWIHREGAALTAAAKRFIESMTACTHDWAGGQEGI